MANHHSMMTSLADDGEEDNDDNSEEEMMLEEPEEEEKAIGRRGRRTGRGVTLVMLLNDGILKPGERTMSIDYLGKSFIGDLLANGKIRWQETRQLFNSPSAWAIHCKKQINPDKKSGCGWASVKYMGKKLDFYKTLWFKKHRTAALDDHVNGNGVHTINGNELMMASTHPFDHRLMTPGKPVVVNKSGEHKRLTVTHSSLGFRNPEHDPNLLVDTQTFSALGKIQPFTVTVSTNCLFLMDFHCHLTTSEVVGYLAGAWDVNTHNLAVLQAFPCRCRLGDKESAPEVEEQIRQRMERQGLQLVGWYHSHPTCDPQPTIRDISTQIHYQIKLKGNSDSSYTPCLGMICSPYNRDLPNLDSSVLAYWIMPPPENRPMEYGKPMLMNFALTPEGTFSHELLSEVRSLYEYYKKAPDLVDFKKDWTEDGISYLEKLQCSLRKKIPAEITDEYLSEIIETLIESS